MTGFFFFFFKSLQNKIQHKLSRRDKERSREREKQRNLRFFAIKPPRFSKKFVAKFQDNFCEPLAHRECVLMALKKEEKRQKNSDCAKVWKGWLVVFCFLK